MKRIAIPVLLVLIVFTAAYTAITLYDENLKIGRMWETPAVRPHEAPLLVMQPGVVPFDGGEAVFRTGPGKGLISPLDLKDASIIDLGKNGYFTYCVHCHGKYLDGNGTVGQSFHPLPGDLRSPRVQSMSPGVLFKEISYGIPQGRQPPLATTVEIPDRWRIIAYIKALGPRE